MPEGETNTSLVVIGDNNEKPPSVDKIDTEKGIEYNAQEFRFLI